MVADMTDLIKRLRLQSEHIPVQTLFDEAADCIKELNERLTAATDDAKEAEDYAEEVEADRKKTYEALLKMSRIHGEVEAKLAKAEWLLTDAAVQLEEGKIKTRRNRAGLIWQFLDEIKGESHD
jgi:SMC interacting uncharacterized protein involved in chromosome segregation